MIKSAKIYTGLAYFIIIAGILGLLCSPSEAISAAKNGIDMCVNIIIPSLFPFFVFSYLFIETGLAKETGKIFEPLMRPVFNVNGSCSSAFFLGLLSGYPIGAKTAINLFKKGLCSKREAERLLSFCNNSGPAFVLGSVGIGIWGRLDVGLLLYFSQIIASIITGVLFGLFWKGKNQSITFKKEMTKDLSLTDAFVSGVKNSAVNILYICAFIIFFAVTIRLLFVYNIIPFTAGLLSGILKFIHIDNKSIEQLLSGFFELTTGIKYAYNAAPLAKNLALTGAILGWAGLSVHCQVLVFLHNSGLSTKPYILGKFVQAVIGAAITYTAVMLFPFNKEVFSRFSVLMPSVNMSFLNVFFISICIIAGFIILLTIFIIFFKNIFFLIKK